MRFLITAGPTREYIDTVRFISNASSGRMGFAIAEAAIRTSHDVTLLTGPVSIPPPEKATVLNFISIADLQSALDTNFDSCDVLIMAAAVGDFIVAEKAEKKISRKAGPITLRLDPTPDVLASIADRKRADQTVVAFAVEDGTPKAIETMARQKLIAKHADISVVNTPAAFASSESLACILSADKVLLPWAKRSKVELAGELVKLISSRR